MALTKIKADGLTADLIDETKLADNSIDSEHYNDGSIDNAHLADDAVGTAEIADDAVTADKLANAINTDIAAKAVLTGSTNNTITTVTGANAIQGEANLTFDGTSLKVGASTSTRPISIYSASDAQIQFQGTGTGTGNNNADGFIVGNSGGVDATLWNYENGYLRFATNNAEAARIDSSGRLLLGTTSPGESNGDEATFYNNGNAGITIRSAADNECKVYFSEGTSGGSQYRGAINYNHNTHYMSFSANESERIRILGTGGITFNGDTATANAIDDYEEGTWTPTLTGATIGTTHSAVYTKIGNVVYIQGYLETNSGSGGSAVYIGGLPYTVTGASSNTVYSYACGRMGNGGHNNAASDIIYQINAGGTTITLYVEDGGVNWNMISSVHLIFSGFYFT